MNFDQQRNRLTLSSYLAFLFASLIGIPNGASLFILATIFVPICLYRNSTKFGQLIFRKIIKIVVTRSPIFMLYCTKFDFVSYGTRSDPVPLVELLSVLPDPSLNFWGPISEGRERTRGKGEKEEGAICKSRVKPSRFAAQKIS